MKSYSADISQKSAYIMFMLLGVRGGLCNPSYWDGGIRGWLVDREPPKGSKWPTEGRTTPGV